MTFDDNITGQDFLVRVRPMMSGDEWSGQIDMSIITSIDNNLDDESYGQILHLCKMICATVPIMENDEVFGDFVHSWVLENIDGEQSEEEEKAVDITHEDGNVVRLSFATRTKGSA
jgi:hypothetical protein